MEAGLVQHFFFLKDKHKKSGEVARLILSLHISRRGLSQMSCLFTCRFPVNNMLNLKPYSGKICTAGLKGTGKAGNFPTRVGSFLLVKLCNQMLF